MYEINEHRKRFAVWTASRAASVKGCRFSVEIGKSILEQSSLNNILEVSSLPEPEDFDNEHKNWREEIIKIASVNHLNLTHGVAAKLINVYLKTLFVIGGYHDVPKVKAVHPPIDSLILKSLYLFDKKRWRYLNQIRWSKLNSDQYELLILNFKAAVDIDPNDNNISLWKIEEHWRGYQ